MKLVAFESNVISLNPSLIGIGTAVGLCLFLLYSRKKKWANPRRRWFICSGLFAIGGIGFFSNPSISKSEFMLYWGVCAPLVYYATDRLFRYLSIQAYGRDFILWLRYSDEIDDSIGGRNPHIKMYDKVFSLSLLILIVTLTAVGASWSH